MTRHYMRSLDPDDVSAKEFQNIVLGHWEREVSFSSEGSLLCRGQACLRERLGKGVDDLDGDDIIACKLMKKDERTLKEIREKCAIIPMETAETLGHKKILVCGRGRGKRLKFDA